MAMAGTFIRGSKFCSLVKEVYIAMGCAHGPFGAIRTLRVLFVLYVFNMRVFLEVIGLRYQSSMQSPDLALYILLPSLPTGTAH